MRKMKILKYFYLGNNSNYTENRKMRCAGHVALMTAKHNPYRILVEKPEGNRPLEKLNSVALVRKRTMPTERPPLVSEASANFCE
jgi:hypothetical protein